MKNVKNIAASVKARLQNVAAKRGEEFNLLLIRYGIERLLYRLSQSKYAERFLLKGAMLFAVWDEKTPRHTRDLDLLGFVPAEKQEMLRIFQEIVTTPVVDDGLVFNPASVESADIRKDSEYGGIRVKLLAMLGTAEVPVQIDVGAGDVVTPSPETITFPGLLDFPAPRIRSYPVYTVVAEKFEVMVARGETNTRLKDFYDLWFLSRRFEFDKAMLKKAIHATFAQRGTKLPEMPEPFTDALANAPIKQTQWSAFLRRNGLAEGAKPFAEIVGTLRDFIAPIFH